MNGLQRMPMEPGPPDGAGDLSTRTTLTLLSEGRRGNDAATEELFRRYRMRLRRWGKGRIPAAARDLVDTDDLVQDVLSRTLAHLESFDPEHSGAFQRYLRQSFLRLVYDHQRRIRRKPPAELTVGGLVGDAPSPMDTARLGQLLDRYEQALLRLTDIEREAVIGRVEFGLSYGELAEQLGKPSADAARVSVARALKKLAERMGDHRPSS